MTDLRTVDEPVLSEDELRASLESTAEGIAILADTLAQAVLDHDTIRVPLAIQYQDLRRNYKRLGIALKEITD